jgi:hypothetical protein
VTHLGRPQTATPQGSGLLDVGGGYRVRFRFGLVIAEEEVARGVAKLMLAARFTQRIPRTGFGLVGYFCRS